MFNGGVASGLDWVVFVIDGDGLDKKLTTDGIYCGVMTHDGVKIQGDFAICFSKA